MSKLFRAIRILIWLQFAALSSKPLLIALNLAVLYFHKDAIVISIIVCSIVFHLAKPVASRLRPRQAFGPPKVKPLIAGLVKAVRKDEAPSPGKSAFSRGLSPQLKTLLKRPANQKPAAMQFEEEKKAAKVEEAV